MKNIKKLLGIMMAATILVGCGKSSDDAAKDPSPEAGQTVEDSKEEDAVAAAFGEKTVAENPLSDETKAKLDALDTNYKKVNWDAVYSAPDNEGIVISETAYFDKQDSLHNRLVVAFTNVTDEPVKFSCEGYAQNAEEKVVADIVDHLAMGQIQDPGGCSVDEVSVVAYIENSSFIAGNCGLQDLF